MKAQANLLDSWQKKPHEHFSFNQRPMHKMTKLSIG